MDINKPLRIVLFSYDLLRLLFLAVSFSFFQIVQQGIGQIFPYLVYLSSNTLFPMITLFVCIRPQQYRNFLPLYITGKIIAVILFTAWAAFSLSQEFESVHINQGNYLEIMILLGGVFFIGLADVLSVFGIWMMNKKIPAAGVPETGINGGI